MARGTWRSRVWLSYLAQALNFQWTRPIAARVGGVAGPDDERRPRVAGPDPVGLDRMQADLAQVHPRPGRVRSRPPSRPAERLCTRISTRSTRARWRTISV